MNDTLARKRPTRFEEVDAAWDLAVRATTYGRGFAQPPGLEQYWQAVFAAAAGVDGPRSLAEGGEAPTRVYLRSPYGVRWRPEHGDWIPFRHAEVTLPPLDLD